MGVLTVAVAEEDRLTIPCQVTNYLLAHVLLARYWEKRRVEELTWLLHAMGNRYHVSSPKYCHKCHKGIATHTLLGALLCERCLSEFILAKTKVLTTEEP